MNIGSIKGDVLLEALKDKGVKIFPGHQDDVLDSLTDRSLMYKSQEAFEDKDPDIICYVPELHRVLYTRRMIEETCINQLGNKHLADQIFFMLEWQDLCTVIIEYKDDREMVNDE